MTRCSKLPLLTIQRVAVTLLSVCLLTPTPAVVWAHGGHGNEFQEGSQAAESAGAIQVDGATAKRLGLKVEPLARQRFAFGIKTTGKIEALPNQAVEVTTPVGSSELLVKRSRSEMDDDDFEDSFLSHNKTLTQQF